MSEYLDLADWRRSVAAMYDALRTDRRAAALRLVRFRAAKDRLFAEHPSSPIPPDARRGFRGLAYWRHDPALRFAAPLEPDPEAPPLDVPRSGEGPPMPFIRIGWVDFTVRGADCRLAVYWLNDYAGGIFIPFRDATSGSQTYGGGRYLWDSAKGADLGTEDGRLVLDFNYAYHPSCVYDPKWSCPLAPQENWLAAPIEAGERLEPVQA
ncbi:MAG TPA: DUF1684 domain-containing protein [candidate division Zixibacteria bacterium]|nr:DUF1684 domain-containing protein [candidate division Zixibacteria bacterium]